MPFHARSAALMLIIFAAVYGWYFAVVARAGPSADVSYAPLLVGMVVLLVVLAIIGHIAIAIAGAVLPGQSDALDDRYDERDRLIEQRADARAGYVLTAGALAVLALAMKEAPHFWIAHAILAALVVSEMVKQALRLVDYWRGV